MNVNHVNSNQTSFQSYKDLLPSTVAETAIYSFGAAFICSSLLQNDLNRSLFSATLSAAISIVTSLTLPFWRSFFAQSHGRMSASAEAFRPIFNFVASTVLYNTVSDFKVRVIASLFLTGCMNYVLLTSPARSLNGNCPSAEGYVFV